MTVWEDRRTHSPRGDQPVSSPFLTPGAGPVRAKLERRAAVVVLWLAHLPRFLPAAIVGVVFLLGLVLPGVAGAVLLLACLVLLALLTYLAWPSTPAGGRPVRLVVLVAVVIFAVSKLT
jgi:hypothetical protein